MHDWIVETKLRPPLAIPGQIDRDRVTQTLDKVLTGGVGILHAPAGYGKSTALASWHSQLLAEGTPTAWLNLDEGDQSLNTFLSYLMAACRQGGFDVFEPFSDLDLGAIPEDEAAQACFTALSRLGSRHALILDDFHRAASEPVQQFINRLCHLQPKDLGLVISTREVPMKALLADLRVSGRLWELSQRELSFRREELSSLLLAQNASLELQDDWLSDLETRTEGWPVAVASVMRWLSQGSSGAEVLQRLSGREKVLSEYFLEQAFQELSAMDQRFLLATSILERVNGDIAQALCPDIDGWETLNRLEHQDAFVLRADNEGNWYRYHRLYAEFLAQIRRRSSNFDDQALHKAAADWFSEHRYLPEAVQHTTATGDVLRCAELLESLGGWQYALRGDLALVQSTLKKLSISNLIDFPRLWLARIYLSVRIGHHRAGMEDLKRYLAEIESSLTDDPVLRSETTLIETLVQRYTDSPVTRSNIDRLERLADDLPPDNDVLQAVRSNFLCAMYREVADYQLSETHAKSAILHYQAMDAAYAEAFIYYHQGLASMRQAQFSTATKEYDEGLAIALRLFGADSDLAAIGQIFLAECHLEAARVEKAKSLLDSSLPHVERADAWLEVYASGYGTLLRIAYATSDSALIERAMIRAQQTATRRQLPRLGAYIRLLDADLRLRQAPERPPMQADVPLDSTVEWDQVSHQLRTSCATRELMLQGRFDDAREALLPALKESKETGFFRAYLHFSLLLAATEWARGEAQAAFEAFESAVSIAIVEDARQVFVEDAELLTPILNGILDEDAALTIAPARMSYLRQLRADMQERTKSVEAQSCPLSARELQILRCLMMGESNREIATGKAVSINTVKFHLKNIFSKLGASSRDEAVAFAIRDQLI